MRKLKNLVGKRFGRLLVLEKSETIGIKTRWDCICDCGNYKTINATNLMSGNTKSCGC